MARNLCKSQVIVLGGLLIKHVWDPRHVFIIMEPFKVVGIQIKRLTVHLFLVVGVEHAFENHLLNFSFFQSGSILTANLDLVGLRAPPINLQVDISIAQFLLHVELVVLLDSFGLLLSRFGNFVCLFEFFRGDTLFLPEVVSPGIVVFFDFMQTYLLFNFILSLVYGDENLVHGCSISLPFGFSHRSEGSDEGHAEEDSPHPEHTGFSLTRLISGLGVVSHFYTIY